MTTSAERQGLVTIVGIPGLWATLNGGNIKAAVTEVWNGGAKDAEKISAPPTTDDIKVDRPYDPELDQQYVRDLRHRVGSWRTTITYVETDADLTPIGEPTVYANALLTEMDPPMYDASSGKEQRWGLSFAVRRAA